MPHCIHRFAGRTAIVSGGAGGMGAACVERLASEGARVFALDIDGARAESLAARLRTEGLAVEALQADVMDEAQLTQSLIAAQRRAQAVDILINVAGGSTPGLIAELDTKTWDR